MVDAGPQNTTLPNVTFPSTQAVYGNVTFSVTSPGAPLAALGNTTVAPGNNSTAALPLFPVVEGVYSLVRMDHHSHPFSADLALCCFLQSQPPGVRVCGVVVYSRLAFGAHRPPHLLLQPDL